MTEITTDIQPTVIEARQAEVAAYSTNIDNYQNILLTINGEWDADLIQFKGIEDQEAARQCSMERLERLAELQLHNQIEKLLKTEIVEKTKAQLILNTLLNS